MNTYSQFMLLFIQLELIILKILTSNRFKRQDMCFLQPEWKPVNDTVDFFKRFYLMNFKEKKVTSYAISNRFEMETRFNFKIPCGTMEYDPAAAITEGHVSPDKAWPWQVRVFSKDSSCGGVLIDANWVITAAHCFESNATFTVRLGTRYKTANINVVEREAKYIILHEDYARKVDKGLNDIALIKLSSPVTFTDRVRPACLPVYGQDFFNNDFCYITGFGQRRPGVYVDELHQLKVYVVPERECVYIRKQDPFSQIDWRTLCAGRVRGRGGPCTGDSGSPLSCKIGNRYYVTGVASYARKNCIHAYIPDVYTKVTEYINWIFHKMDTHS